MHFFFLRKLKRKKTTYFSPKLKITRIYLELSWKWVLAKWLEIATLKYFQSSIKPKIFLPSYWWHYRPKELNWSPVYGLTLLSESSTPVFIFSIFWRQKTVIWEIEQNNSMLSSKWFFNENRWSVVNTKRLHMQNCPQTLNLASKILCLWKESWPGLGSHCYNRIFFPMSLSFSKVDVQTYLRHHCILLSRRKIWFTFYWFYSVNKVMYEIVGMAGYPFCGLLLMHNQRHWSESNGRRLLYSTQKTPKKPPTKQKTRNLKQTNKQNPPPTKNNNKIQSWSREIGSYRLHSFIELSIRTKFRGDVSWLSLCSLPCPSQPNIKESC